jgi:hypothetical protein
MGSMSWQPQADRIAKGAEPSTWLPGFEQEIMRRGRPDRRDCTLIGRTATASIWHTKNVASYDVPHWLPPFAQAHTRGIYRGFAWDALPTVLETGLDVPERAAFFATPYADKAWEYPTGRMHPAMLVLDERHAARSGARKPADATDDWAPATTLYPGHYRDGSAEVHTRFAAGHGRRCFLDETMHGYWVPGDARTALIAVILGGPAPAVMQLLGAVSAHSGLEVLR